MANQYSDRELVESLRKFAAQLGRPPTASEVNDDSEYTAGLNTYTRRFGSWNETLERCGLRVNEEKGYDNTQLIEQLQDLHHRLGTVPTQADLADDDETPSLYPYQDTFGSWNDALRTAGLEPTQRHRISDDELVDELTTLADELGRPPRYQELSERDDTFSPIVYERAFGSFTDSLRAAGLPVNFRASMDRDYLIDQLQGLADELGRTPQYDDLQEYPTYPSTWPYVCEFDSWNEALREAGFDINLRSSVSAEEIIAQLQSVADKLGQTPSVTEWREMDDTPGVATVARQFGSWIAAIDAAGLEHRDWSGENHPRYKHGEKLYYGPNWAEQREVAVLADGEQCRCCGMSRDEHVVLFEQDLHVHHIRPLHDCLDAGLSYEEANDRSNLMALCAECHTIVEENGLE